MESEYSNTELAMQRSLINLAGLFWPRVLPGVTHRGKTSTNTCSDNTVVLVTLLVPSNTAVPKEQAVPHSPGWAAKSRADSWHGQMEAGGGRIALQEAQHPSPGTPRLCSTSQIVLWAAQSFLGSNTRAVFGLLRRSPGRERLPLCSSQQTALPRLIQVSGSSCAPDTRKGQGDSGSRGPALQGGTVG